MASRNLRLASRPAWRRGARVRTRDAPRFLAGREPITIELETQHADHTTGSLVAINKGMILYDACRVLGGKFNKVRASVRDMIQWPSQSRLKQRGVPYALSTAFKREVGESPLRYRYRVREELSARAPSPM